MYVLCSRLAPLECPTCGQFLSYLEKLTESEQTIHDLKQLINELEEGCVMKVDPEDVNCVLNVGEVHRTFPNMNFLLTSSRTICYCDVRELCLQACVCVL